MSGYWCFDVYKLFVLWYNLILEVLLRPFQAGMTYGSRKDGKYEIYHKDNLNSLSERKGSK